MILRFLKVFFFIAILFVPAGGINSASACVAGGPSPQCKTEGAPGPIAGAGLPVLAIGYGAYWLAKRLRRRPD
jgi:hypothetical protein